MIARVVNKGDYQSILSPKSAAPALYIGKRTYN
ncbi:MAG: hypothetical protein ACJA1X_002024 [Bermanella sp.]|jgi:hypothetical protein